MFNIRYKTFFSWIFLAVCILASIYFQGCEKQNKFKIKKSVTLDTQNYVKLAISDFDKLESYAEPQNIKYKIYGKVSGEPFEKKIDGIGAWDIDFWNNKILVASVDGFFLYSPCNDLLKWVFRDENILINGFMKLNNQSGKLYTCGTIPSENMQKVLIAIDLSTGKNTKLNIGEMPQSITLVGSKGVAIISDNKIVITPLEDGNFDFIAEQ